MTISLAIQNQTAAVELTAATISAVLAVVLSMALAYIPGFKDKWDACLHKRTLWAIGGLVVALLIAVLDELGAINAGVPRPFIWQGLITVFTAWLFFIGAGQLTYTLSSSPERLFKQDDPDNPPF